MSNFTNLKAGELSSKAENLSRKIYGDSIRINLNSNEGELEKILEKLAEIENEINQISNRIQGRR